MRAIQVQFELPVDKPEEKLRIKRTRKMITIYAPANLPDIHIMTLTDLLRLAQTTELLGLCADHNKEITPYKEESLVIAPVSNLGIDTYMPNVAPSTS